MANLTVTSNANFIPEIWASEALEAIEFAQITPKRVNLHWEEYLNKGDTLHIPRLSNPTAQTKSADTAVTMEVFGPSDVEGVQDITVTTQTYVAFQVERVLKVQANQELQQKYARKIGYALNRNIETTLTARFDAFSNAVGSAGVEITDEQIRRGWQYLADAGLFGMETDPDGDFSFITSPAGYSGLMAIDRYVRKDYNQSGNAVERASVGDIYGFNVFVSNLLESDAAGQHDAVMMHRDALALIQQQNVTVDTHYIIEHISDAVVGWTLFGTAEMNFPPETAGGGTAVDDRAVYVRGV